MPKKIQGWTKAIQTPVPFNLSTVRNTDWSIKAIFHLRFLCMGSVQWAKFKGIITITGVPGFFNGQNDVGVFDLHASDTSECKTSLSEK